MILIAVVSSHRKFFISKLLSYATTILLSLFRSVETSTLSEFYFDYFWLLSFAMFFYTSFYAEQYRFEQASFTHSCILPCTPFPHFGTYVTKMEAGTLNPESSYM